MKYGSYKSAFLTAQGGTLLSWLLSNTCGLDSVDYLLLFISLFIPQKRSKASHFKSIWTDASSLKLWSACPLTGDLSHHCLRDPSVPQEGFDLLFHHAAVPPANKQEQYKSRT